MGIPCRFFSAVCAASAQTCFHDFCGSLFVTCHIPATRSLRGREPAGINAYLSPAPHAVPHAAGVSAGLSPAPQAVPQAEGFSAGLSPAPQAVPHAAGFSAGLSPAPQAVPHAAAGDASIFLFHPKRFESAIVISSFQREPGASCRTPFSDPNGFFRLQLHCRAEKGRKKVRTLLCHSYEKVTFYFPLLNAIGRLPGLSYKKIPRPGQA